MLVLSLVARYSSYFLGQWQEWGPSRKNGARRYPLAIEAEHYQEAQLQEIINGQETKIIGMISMMEEMRKMIADMSKSSLEHVSQPNNQSRGEQV